MADPNDTIWKGAVENLVNGDQVLPRLLADIDAAQKSIHISMFLFFNDPVGQEVADHLIARAQAGVAVRVMLNSEKSHLADPFSTGEKNMFKNDPRWHEECLDINALRDRLRKGGVQFNDDQIDYNKAVSVDDPQYALDESAIRAAVQLQQGHIDHRKLVAIDGNIGYCGSANIGVQYMYHLPFDPLTKVTDEIKQGKPEAWDKWHDGLIRFEGEIVGGFEERFRERWILNGGTEFAPIVGAPLQKVTGRFVESMRIVSCQPSNVANPIRELFKQMIAGAKSNIFIENPYFYHPEIVDAICAAKKANPALDVVLIQPTRDLNDSAISADAQEFRYQRYLPLGIRVFEYRNHFNHLKLATFDDRWSIVGSANMNYRSMENDKDFEMVVLVDDLTFASSINNGVRNFDIPYAHEVTAADLNFSTNNRQPQTVLLETAKEV